MPLVELALNGIVPVIARKPAQNVAAVQHWPGRLLLFRHEKSHFQRRLGILKRRLAERFRLHIDAEDRNLDNAAVGDGRELAAEALQGDQLLRVDFERYFLLAGRGDRTGRTLAWKRQPIAALRKSSRFLAVVPVPG